MIYCTYTGQRFSRLAAADCPPGQQWIAATQECQPCPPGEASPGGPGAVCTPCPEGWWLNGDASLCYRESRACDDQSCLASSPVHCNWVVRYQRWRRSRNKPCRVSIHYLVACSAKDTCATASMLD
jgi:hypothetical protein